MSLARHGEAGTAEDSDATRRLRDELRRGRLARSSRPRTSPPLAATPVPNGPGLRRIGMYLEVTASDAALVRCRRCGHRYCPATENHKEYAALEETTLPSAQANLVDVSELVLRRYYCPGCATQFWVDVAERGDPIEFDVRLSLPGLAPAGDR